MLQLPINLSIDKEFGRDMQFPITRSISEEFVHVDQHIMLSIRHPPTSVFLYVKGLSPTRNAYTCLLTSIQLHPGLAFTPLTFIVFRSASLSSHLQAAA